jgi:mono/diheme cytochrome c family protein
MRGAATSAALTASISALMFGCLCAAAPAGHTAGTVWDGVYSAEQATRGQRAFGRSCGGCHGDDLSGGDDGEPALRGPEFASHWDGAPLAELLEMISVDMPRTSPGSLTPDAYLDILAFILTKNGFPPGATELASDKSRLQQILFTSVRPTN